MRSARCLLCPLILLRAALVAEMLVSGASAQSVSEEYRVKAAFLYNFAKFVEWPAGAFRSADDPIALCILGQSPFGNTLEEMVGQNSAGGRHFVVRKLDDEKLAAGCHIVFISGSERTHLRGILESISMRSVLTVSDLPDFASEGGAFGFRIEHGKVRVEINTTVVKEKDLRVSSRLMSLAQRVP